MGTGTNQKYKYTPGSFHGEQTWTDWMEQEGGGGLDLANFWVQGWELNFQTLE